MTDLQPFYYVMYALFVINKNKHIIDQICLIKNEIVLNSNVSLRC